MDLPTIQYILHKCVLRMHTADMYVRMYMRTTGKGTYGCSTDMHGHMNLQYGRKYLLLQTYQLTFPCIRMVVVR